MASRSVLALVDQACGVQLELLEGFHRRGISTRLVLVFLGYVTPEATPTFERVANELLVYSPVTFRACFAKLLGPAVSEAAGASDADRERMGRAKRRSVAAGAR